MSRSELPPEDSSPDPAQTLERHIRAGFQPDLALDLVLNEIVVRAAEATHASAAALALFRGGEMVCRAATGPLAPDLGIPINTRDGLSGACLQTRQPQLSVDTEFDPRIDPAVSHRLGIRSILIVPVFDSTDKNAPFTGVLEVFSTSPAAFSDSHQKLLQGFAEECARMRRLALELAEHKPASAVAPDDIVPAGLVPPDVTSVPAPPVRRNSYEAWTLVLGGLAILVIIAVSFLFGTRIGWLRSSFPHVQFIQPQNPIQPANDSATKSAPTKSAETKSAPPASAKSATAPADELVVYEKGKVVFRLKPNTPKPEPANHKTDAEKPDRDSSSIVQASSTEKIPASQSVWLSPAEAGPLLLSRTEPVYPAEALAAHRSGTVLLEIEVDEGGSVSSLRTLNGDPVLAAAAAEAVRKWRYQPYRQHNRPSQFQTDVTLSFTLPN